MAYRVMDKESCYRRDIFRHFTQDCRCSMSMTARRAAFCAAREAAP